MLCRITLTLLLGCIGVVYSQGTSNKFKTEISNTNGSIVEISNESIQKLNELGFEFSPHYDYLGRNFSEHFDFNNDGFKDIVWTVPKNPSIGSPLMLLFWDQEQGKYIEQTSYFILGHGDHMMYYDTVDDFDGDGDLDIFLPTENYHGEWGKQPNYYFPEGNFVPGNMLFNDNQKLTRVYIDTTTIDHGDRKDYLPFWQAALIEYDEDDKKDLIVSSVNVHPDGQGYLATRYTISSEQEIGKEFVFPWESDEMYQGQSHSLQFKNYDDKIYVFMQSREDINPIEEQATKGYSYTHPEIRIYNKSKGPGLAPTEIRRFDLKRNTDLIDQNSIMYHDTYYVEDLDKDGNEEIIIGMFTVPMNDKHSSVHVFDNQGNEVSDKWFQYFEFIETTRAHGNGFDMIDLNGDGFKDILFRDRFNSSDSDISFFLNTGSRFERHVLNTNGPGGFNIAVDTDKDGLYEILKIRNQEPDPNKVVTQYLISYKNISDNDGDGVYDNEDQCPNTPEGVLVDTNGCEIFTLPNDIFSVNSVNSTCIDLDNGSIRLSSTDSNYNYLYSIDGTDPTPVEGEVSITGLGVGSYNVCFTVDGVDNYERCYTVSVGEPDPLDVSSVVNFNDRSLDLNLKGSKSYQVLLNGKELTTDESRISLSLQSGKNTIEVKGEQDCQGIYFEEIFVSEEVKVYPNPTNGPLQLYVSGMDSSVEVSITSINGSVVQTINRNVPMNRVLDLDLTNLNSGTYIVSIKGSTVQVHQKVIKR